MSVLSCESWRNCFADHGADMHRAPTVKRIAPLEVVREGLQVRALKNAQQAVLRRMDSAVAADTTAGGRDGGGRSVRSHPGVARCLEAAYEPPLRVSFWATGRRKGVAALGTGGVLA